MTTLLLSHPACLRHDMGLGHPERPDRLRAIERELAAPEFGTLVRHEAPIADLGLLEFAHPRDYIEMLHEAAPGDDGELTAIDADTVMGPGTWEAALRSVGAGIAAVDAVMSGRAHNAFCATRPPGHHAESRRAMGFCFFSNAAIAAKYARVAYGAERVAVIDFDVHHGNGTQEIFWADRDLFYGSTHQMPLYPGTGAVSETGAGNICNAPLRSGDGGRLFKQACETRILPALRNFSPDLLVISAGFDAHHDDPLGGLELIEADFRWITEKLVEIAGRHCKGRVVSMLEGGYDLGGLARSAAEHVRVLMAAGA